MDSTDLPERLRKLLEGSSVEAPTLAFLNAAAIVLADNKTPFFPAYTDHGSEHVKRVLDATVRLVPDDVLPESPRRESLLHARDACVLICACLLHDIGMHLRVEGFLALVAEDSEYKPLSGFDGGHSPCPPDPPWHELWQSFRQDARHFGKSQLDRLLGPQHNGTPAVVFADGDRHPDRWTEGDRLLIGEFLRRHHARLAHEVAVYGFPGTTAGDFPLLSQTLPALAEPIGVAARSHGEKLRAMIDYCEYRHSGNQRPWGTALPYLMGLLRVADYFQLDAGRAPPLLLRLKNPASRASVDEWDKHAAVSSISWDNTDQLAVYVEVNSSHGLRTHLQLAELLADLQRELDTTTAVLGEVYSTPAMSKLRLSRQRIRTNLADRSLHERLPYIPRRAALRSDEDLFRLVMSDLYGNQPAVAGRELLQNAVDAVRERRRWEARNGRSLDNSQFRAQKAGVRVTVEAHTDGRMTLCVTDRGIGMTPEVVIDYLLKAGASFGPDRADFEHLDPKTSIEWMKAGRFGVGIFAAFLLGPRVEVETRHIGAARGVKFSADINAEDVKLEWADLPLGTKVSIPFEGANGSRLLEAMAEYYRLRKPKVEFRFVGSTGKVSRQPMSGDVPTLGDRSLGQWRAVKTPNFDAVMWTPYTHTPFISTSMQEGEVVHNGITIRAPYEDYFASTFPTYEWSSKRIASLVRSPVVAVFDSRHLLGVALDRYRLKSKTLPFELELLESIGLDIVAWALAEHGGQHPLSHAAWGLSRVIDRKGWIPLLPGLLDEYIEGDLCVLWGVPSSRFANRDETDWDRAVGFFARVDGGIPWRLLPTRVALSVWVDANEENPEYQVWGLRPTDVESAVEKLVRILDATAVTSVMVKRLQPGETRGEVQPKGRAWRSVAVQNGESARSDMVAFVMGDGEAHPSADPRVERLLKAAELIMPHTPRECVGLTMLRIPRSGCSDDLRLAAPWNRLIGGMLERSRAKRKARADRLSAAGPEVRKAIEGWESGRLGGPGHAASARW